MARRRAPSVPPLSRSDLPGYLKLLVAGRRETDSNSVDAQCDRVRAASSHDAISFTPKTQRHCFKAVSDELKADFLLAGQIAPVLALCPEGDPRKTKRVLNALVLRIENGHRPESRLANLQLGSGSCWKASFHVYFGHSHQQRQRTLANRRNPPRSRR